MDLDYDAELRLLQFTIVSASCLLPFEVQKTEYFKVDQEFQVIDKEERLKCVVNLQVPDDAILDNSLEKHEHDTDVGLLIEVHVHRKKEDDKSRLQGKRGRYFGQTAQTTQKLQHNPNQQQGEENGNV